MTTPNETNPKIPTHLVYILKEKTDGEKPDWIKVGAAWEHNDKEGLNISLSLLGQDIPIIIRKNKLKAPD